MMKVLVTGAAGYIGSHATRLLLDGGHSVVALDNLSKGFRKAVDQRADFVEIDIADEELLLKIFEEYQIECVMHFAGFIEVGESVEKPLLYYENNISKSLKLLSAIEKSKIRKFIFSSTAATYGEPQQIPIPESHPCEPINPYGQCKRMFELVLEDCRKAFGLSYAILRYFNVAGAHPSGEIGEAHEPESHLIPRILKSVHDLSFEFKIFGTDYPTPDGTCVRDYIHVMDLVEAHLLAMNALGEKERRIYNLGSKTGFSVKEVLHAAETVLGKKIEAKEFDRRPGDPAQLIADTSKIELELGWKPSRTQIKTIIEDAWRWHQDHPHGYPKDA